MGVSFGKLSSALHDYRNFMSQTDGFPQSVDCLFTSASLQSIFKNTQAELITSTKLLKK